VLHRDPQTAPPMGTAYQFSAQVCCGQTAGWIKMPLGREVDLGPGDIALDGDPVPRRGAAPQFSTHVSLDQTTGWMKMPDGTEVGPTGAEQPSPLFGSCLFWPNGRPSQLLLSTCLFVYEISRELLNGFMPN